MQMATDTTFISHAHEGSTREALGYARGRADESGLPVAGAHHWINPPLAFARAYANARENSTHAPDLRSAFRSWQDSHGETVTLP